MGSPGQSWQKAQPNPAGPDIRPTQEARLSSRAAEIVSQLIFTFEKNGGARSLLFSFFLLLASSASSLLGLLLSLSSSHVLVFARLSSSLPLALCYPLNRSKVFGDLVSEK